MKSHNWFPDGAVYVILKEQLAWDRMGGRCAGGQTSGLQEDKYPVSSGKGWLLQHS